MGVKMANSIRIVRDESEAVYLSQTDLVEILSERLSKFPQEIEALKQPQKSLIVGPDGSQKITPPDPVEVARHEGMQVMLQGVFDMINAKNV